MPKPDIKIEDIKLIPTHLWPKECFACGIDNTYGLYMKFHSDSCKYITSYLKLEERFKGWSQVIHDWIISTILDELMAWAVICMTKNIMLTKSMTTNYYNKVVTKNPNYKHLHGLKKQNQKKAILKSELYDNNNNLCAQANRHICYVSFKTGKKTSFDVRGKYSWIRKILISLPLSIENN